MKTKNHGRRRSISEQLERRVLLTTYTPNLLFTFASPEGISAIFVNSDSSLNYVVGEGAGQIEHFVPGSAPTTLANFGSGINDPNEPMGEQFEDSAGDIFGATQSGGAGGVLGGAIFEWVNGSSSITTLASFSSATTGSEPLADYMDPSGNIYGTTGTGSTDGNGAIWEYHASSQQFTFVPIPSTMGPVEGSLIADSSGDIFGATQRSTTNGPGEFFEISAGTTTITPLATLSTAEPGSEGLLAIDSAGNIFGTASSSSGTSGAFYEVSAANRSTIDYLATVSTNTDGAYLDASGDLFTDGLQTPGDVEKMFELPAGQHTAQQIASLDSATIGDDTFALTIASNGTIYGANQDGAADGNGSLFSLTPSGGGGGGSSSLSASILKSTLPAAVVSGGSTKGSVTVDLTNGGSSLESSSITTHIYASSDGLVDSGAVLIGTSVHAVKLKAGASTPIAVPIHSLPAILSGTYTLVAQVTDTAGNTATTTTGPTLKAAAPFVAFSDTIIRTTLPSAAVSGGKTKASVTLEITNGGNVSSTGDSTVALYASLNTTAIDGRIIRTVSEPIVVKPGASKSVTLPLVSLPAVSDGSYYIDALVTDPKGNVTTAASSSTYTLAAPFISLVPSAADVVLGKAGTSTVSFTVTNHGNITATGSNTIALYATPNGTVASGTQEFTETLSLPLAPGKSKVVKLHLTAAQTQPLQAAASAVLQVTDSMGGVQTLAVVFAV